MPRSTKKTSRLVSNFTTPIKVVLPVMDGETVEAQAQVIIPKSTHFPRVREAREALRERALAILNDFQITINEARANGDFQAALDAQKWLIEHMAKGDNGETIIDSSAAKPVVKEGVSGPTIQIGFKIGAVTEPRRIENE